MPLFEELKRRNVFRVAIAYLALAWLLIEVAGTLFPAFGIPDWAFRFVVIVLVFGFVPVLVVSWAYEITPEGLKREREVVRDEHTKQLTTRRLDWVTISLVVAALGFVMVDRLWLRSGTMHQPAVSGDPVTARGEAIEPETTQLPDSIAVLPFANRSANPDDVFFVDGIHDDLLTFIAQIGSIKTISRTSVMQYRETTKSVKQIANELGVMAVLEGGVQRAGEQVRINVQLIDARTDDHLWSEIYDRQLTAANIFSIQSEIAGSIADALRATLTTTARERIESVPTHSLEALEEYFIGRQLLEKRTVEALLKADDHFEEAIALDPDFALAYVALADTYRLQANYAGFPRDEMIIKGQAAVDKALQLKPLLGEAHTSLANLKNMRGDLEGAEASFKRALELNPNYAPAYQWYGEMLGWNFGRPGPQFNRIEDALELSKKAVTLDPMSPIIHNDYAEVLENAGRLEDALAEYEKAVEIDPGFTVALRSIAELFWSHYGRLDKAYFYYRKSFLSESGRARDPINLAILSGELGDDQLVEAWMTRSSDSVESANIDFLYHFGIGLGHLYRGKDNQALEYAIKAWEIAPRNRDGLLFLGDLELKAGNYKAARERYELSYPEFFNDSDPAVDGRNYPVAIGLASVLLRTGEQDKAEKLLDKSLSVFRTLNRLEENQFGLSDVQVYALRGDSENALAMLRKALDQGWMYVFRFQIEHAPALSLLYDKSEFQAIKQEFEAEMALQLKQVREFEAAGMLP